MRKIWNKGALAALCALLLPLLCGCMFSSAADELYRLPQLPTEYTALERQIDALLAAGAEYAAPQAGGNIQPVQMVDLDGDGTIEALVFLRSSTDDKNLKICIFREGEDTYELAAAIEGGGTSIYSIYYADLDGDGVSELLIGWRLSADVQSLSVYSLNAFSPQERLSSNYVKYNVCDLDGDARQELLILRNGAENAAVDCYAWDNDTLQLLSTSDLSVTVAEVNRGNITAGRLSSGENALFVTGISEAGEAVTDILALGKNGLRDVTMSSVTGVSTLINVARGLFPTDIDGDGVLEVPEPYRFQEDAGLEEQYGIRWCAYDADGKRTLKMTTYHNVADGWYLVLPGEWDGRIAVRSRSAENEHAITFSLWNEGEQTLSDFLAVYTLTGDERERRAALGDRFILSRQTERIYAASFFGGSGERDYGESESALREAFNPIFAEWTTGDN